MNKDNFNALLTDLYNIYNPSKSKEIPTIIEKYNGQEFDAVKTLYFKYNFRAHPKYDPKAGTDKHIKFLIERYSSGERVLVTDGQPKEINIEDITLEQKVAEANTTIQTITDKTKESVEEFFKSKSEELKTYFVSKNDELNKRYSEFDEYVKKSLENINAPLVERQNNVNQIIANDEKVKLKINLNFDDVDLEIPKEVNYMPAGSRFIVLDSQKRHCALEIVDVFMDFVSSPGSCIKEITIERR
jgi:hypothetical protein